MPNEDSPRLKEWAAQLQQMEAELAALQKEVDEFRAFLQKQRTGKDLPSPTSSGARVAIAAIKPYLKSHGPATKEELTEHLLREWKEGKITIIGADEKARIGNIRRSIGRCVAAGTIILQGEKYRIPK